MHGVYQRQSLQTCILKPIHYPHNENLHPTQHGRLGAECEPRTLTLEAVEGMLVLPNYLIPVLSNPAQQSPQVSLKAKEGDGEGGRRVEMGGFPPYSHLAPLPLCVLHIRLPSIISLKKKNPSNP